MAGETVDDVMAQLAAAEDPKFRAVNEKHGDDHGVNLTRLRAIAKQLKTQQELAQSLWNTDDTAAKLVAILANDHDVPVMVTFDKNLRVTSLTEPFFP